MPSTAGLSEAETSKFQDYGRIKAPGSIIGSQTLKPEELPAEPSPKYPSMGPLTDATKNRNPFSPLPFYDYKALLRQIYKEMGILPTSFSGKAKKSKSHGRTYTPERKEEETIIEQIAALKPVLEKVGLKGLKKQEKRMIKGKQLYVVPRTRKVGWPGVPLPPSGTKHVSKKKQLLRRIQEIWRVANNIRKKIEEFEIAEADMDLEPEPYIDEPETEDEEEPPLEFHRLKNLWWKMGKDEDLPVDVALADRYVRTTPKKYENAPIHIQKEQQQMKEFQDYLDNHGVSALVIGILIMMYTKPCYPEGAKEMLRLGLGGKPTEVATAADVLKEIDNAQERITELEGDLHDYQVQVLRLLKEEIYEEPEDPTNIVTPKRRVEYILKAFHCKTRPSDVDFFQIYDMSEIPGLAKYKVKLPKQYEAIGRELAGGHSLTKTDIGTNTKKWFFAAPETEPIRKVDS